MQSSKSPVVLILGAGANIGANLARAFTAKGYKVALAARKLKNETNEEGQLTISSDFADPSSVSAAFSKVREVFGDPSVVVYNAGKVTPNPPNDPLSLPLSNYLEDMNINTTSVFAAAHQAVLGFAQLPPSSSRTFIYTGNCLNTGPILPLLGLGMGKSATAHLIASASQAYKDRGYKFYYADERKADGNPAGGSIDGAAHADFYAKLAEDKEQGPWHATFVNGTGYVEFPTQVLHY